MQGRPGCTQFLFPFSAIKETAIYRVQYKLQTCLSVLWSLLISTKQAEVRQEGERDRGAGPALWTPGKPPPMWGSL